MDFNLDVDTLRSLIKLMADNGLNELELEEEGKRIHLRRGDERSHSVVVPQLAAPSSPSFSLGAQSAPQAPAASAPAAKAGALPPGVKEIKSPMVGTFYRSASPDAPPFTDVGDKVNEESVLCIIEAMKVMNEIKAETRGIIAEILAENGKPVQFGQPLFRLK